MSKTQNRDLRSRPPLSPPAGGHLVQWARACIGSNVCRRASHAIVQLQRFGATAASTIKQGLLVFVDPKTAAVHVRNNVLRFLAKKKQRNACILVDHGLTGTPAQYTKRAGRISRQFRAGAGAAQHQSTQITQLPDPAMQTGSTRRRRAPYYSGTHRPVLLIVGPHTRTPSPARCAQKADGGRRSEQPLFFHFISFLVSSVMMRQILLPGLPGGTSRVQQQTGPRLHCSTRLRLP